MSTILFILALIAFICALSFLLGGFLGLQDFDAPRSVGENLFLIADSIFTGGLIGFFRGAIKNWSSRSYERHIILAGFGCLSASLALGLIAIICR